MKMAVNNNNTIVNCIAVSTKDRKREKNFAVVIFLLYT